MNGQSGYTFRVSLGVALGGFLMGFDASVISGVTGAIETEFGLTSIQLGWAVASLTLTATLGMLLSGPLSDRYGRRMVLRTAAILFGISAIASAYAYDLTSLTVARMLGGLGVGAALIVAPMYIAELAPADRRGRLVSLNQLNIVVGISAAYFSNFLILKLSGSGAEWVAQIGLDTNAWRWMLGIEALPAVIYLLALTMVPESPRWLVLKGRDEEARSVLNRTVGEDAATTTLAEARNSVGEPKDRKPVRELFAPAVRAVLIVGISVSILQQITGINAVFFYAPMIFEQSGIGTDASFMQAVLVGLTNVVFTVLAIMLIDRLGRRPLLLAGLAGIAICMALLAYGFGSATYTIDPGFMATIAPTASFNDLVGTVFTSDVAFRDAVTAVIGQDLYAGNQSDIVASSITMNPTLILVGILGFVASFAMSLGPVMWVLFSELFPNRLRGLAVSFVGLINSAVSFLVQLVFPYELETLGNAATFAVFGALALVGFFIILKIMPETKGDSLEDLEARLVRA